MSAELAIQTEQTGISLFDSNTFEQMGLIASKLAQSSLIPETLRTEGTKGNKKNLPLEVVTANCFRIVEQAQRWGMSPFAVIDCASVVHGKLMWEGKLISAALEATMGIRLNYNYSGEGMSRKIIVSGKFPDESTSRTVEGTVEDWKTDQWKSSDYDQRLAYRGAREWSRRHSPAVILGVYTPDEFNDDQPRVKSTEGRVVHAEPISPFPTHPEITDQPEAPAELSQEVKAEAEQGLERWYVQDVKVATGAKDNKPWTRHDVLLATNDSSIKASTFSKRVGANARSLLGQWAMFELRRTNKGVELMQAISEENAPSHETPELVI